MFLEVERLWNDIEKCVKATSACSKLAFPRYKSFIHPWLNVIRFLKKHHLEKTVLMFMGVDMKTILQAITSKLIKK